jgi:glycosyltransferase involved in cell wall biosynthesis
VLTVSTADQRKNLAALAPAARALDELGIDLVWAGDSRPYFASSSPPDGVRALGYVPDDVLPGLYAGARVFVLPSRYEGLGLTCLEAMACGTPVVAADIDALRETCEDAALLVDPDDPHGIANAVIRVLTDEPLRAELTAAGVARAEKFGWEQAARETFGLLESIAWDAC